MTSESDLIPLLYRADWTKLSLSAEVHRVDARQFRWKFKGLAPGRIQQQDPGRRAGESTGRLLIAPGGRFRMRTTDEDGTWIQGCDGEKSWQQPEPRQDEPDAEAEAAAQTEPAEEVTADEVSHPRGGPEPPPRELLCPSWLLKDLELELRETTAAGGRDVYRVVARPRPGVRYVPDPLIRADRVEALVDTDLGIVIWLEQMSGGQIVRLAELRDIRLDPPEVADLAQFAPPPGSVPGEGSATMFSGPGWQAAKTVAGAAATGLGFAIKYAPHRSPQSPEDEEAAMPRDDPETRAGERTHTQPVSDALINLVYRASRQFPAVAAEMHEWFDPGAMLEFARSAVKPPGMGDTDRPAPSPLAEALTERFSGNHRVTRIRFAPGGRYRIDRTFGERKREPTTIACDGQRRWKVYQDHVAVGPASAPLPPEVAYLIDPSWLLEWRLSDGAELTVSGRRALRISTARDPNGQYPPAGIMRPMATMMFPPAEAVVHAELGILLRLTAYAGGRPAMRLELRDISRFEEPGSLDFRIEAPPGMRVIEHGGGLLDESDAPEAVKMAAKGVIEISRRAGSGVSALTDLYDAVRGKKRHPPRG